MKDSHALSSIYTLYAVAFLLVLGVESAFLVSTKSQIIFLVLSMPFGLLALAIQRISEVIKAKEGGELWGERCICAILLISSGVMSTFVPTMLLGGIVCFVAAIATIVEWKMHS